MQSAKCKMQNCAEHTANGQILPGEFMFLASTEMIDVRKGEKDILKQKWCRELIDNLVFE